MLSQNLSGETEIVITTQKTKESIFPRDACKGSMIFLTWGRKKKGEEKKWGRKSVESCLCIT